jgi:RNA polymerase sigma-70 factor, ECF subfamily
MRAPTPEDPSDPPPRGRGDDELDLVRLRQLLRGAPPQVGEGLGLLHDLFGPRVIGFLRNKGASGQDVFDLVQQTFLRIQEGVRSVRMESLPQLRKWIFRVAENVLNDHWRKQGRRPPEEELDDPEPPESDPPCVEMADCRRCVARALAELGRTHERRYRALKLVYYHGWSGDEVARELGLAAGGIREFMSTCRKQLREVLERDCEGCW